MDDITKPAQPRQNADNGTSQPNDTPPQQSPRTDANQRDTEQKVQTALRFGHELHWLEKLNLFGQISLVIVGAVAATIYGYQLREMKRTNDLTKQALAGNDNTLAQTLAKMQGQIDATNKLYVEAQKQTLQAVLQAHNTGIQAIANARAANTAKLGVDTAIESLHISQRAVITLANASVDVPGYKIMLPVLNTGHIPSGEATIIVHEATSSIPNTKFPQTGTVIESHWASGVINSLAPGSPYSLFVNVPRLDSTGVNDGHQYIVVAGTVNYNDGFINSPPQKWRFCVYTHFDALAKRSLLIPCDPSEMIPKLMLIENYPNNKEQ